MSLDLRCAGCGAGLRAGAPWCTQCYAPVPALVTAPAPAPAPVPALVPAPVPALVPAPAPSGEPTWPCSRCGTANPVAAAACTACGAGFLAGAHDDEALLALPVVGDLGRFSRAQRLALAGGAALLLALLTALLGLLA